MTGTNLLLEVHFKFSLFTVYLFLLADIQTQAQGTILKSPDEVGKDSYRVLINS